MEKQLENKKLNLVLGRVVDKLNRPLENLVVQAFDVDMRSKELLGECITNRRGDFKIYWMQSHLSERGKKEADIAVKVFTPEKKTLLFESDMDSVRFNASEREEINIIIEKPVIPEVVEYESIMKTVNFLVSKVAITDLQESERHRDITFISKEARIPADKLEHFVIANRLQSESNIDAAFFYALLRKNTLLKNDFSKSLHVRFGIDINTETKLLLYDSAIADLKTIQRDVASAVKEMIVSDKVKEDLRKYFDQLQKYKKEAEDYYSHEHPRKVWNLISRFVLDDKVDEMKKLFQENKNDINSFLKKITDEFFFKNQEAAKETQATIALSELFGFDETIIEQIKESQNIRKPEDIKKLAALNKAGWKEVLVKSAGKINTAGIPLDEKLIDLHASSIVRKMEKEYPTGAFSAQLAREKKSIFENQVAMKEFFAKHEDFDLQNSSIDLFIKNKNLTSDNNEAMIEELKSVQRVFKLVPQYSKTNALLQHNINSSQNIVAIGETRFVKEIAPKSGINAKEAREIFRKAEQTSTAAMLLAGKFQDTLRTIDVPAIRTKTLTKKLEAVSKDFPNLKTLFKLTDLCSCDHGRSVLSPAAYLVEILQFLDNRSVTDLTTTPPTTSRFAKDVLFERRPDLGDIDLSAENAETPIPYIDLVCELLEEAVAPDTGISYTGKLSDGADPLTGKISVSLFSVLQAAGMPVTSEAEVFETETKAASSAMMPHYLRDKKVVCKIINNGGNNYTIYRLRQTLSSAEELSAAPEYVNTNAYDELKNAQYAFKLPFDLNNTEANAYLSRFDISRSELMKEFQSSGNPSDEAIAAEKLGLTDNERQLIVTSNSSLSSQQLFWNAPPQWDIPPVYGNVLDYMKRVDHFLDKTGLTYNELTLLLSLKFIDPNNNLFIKHNYEDPSAANPTISCDTAKKEIAGLDLAALDRIHRFLRLQKKVAWSFETLDAVISQERLGNNSLNNDCLIKAADLVKLSEETGIKLEELIGFYGEIPYKELNDDAPKPLYHQLFLNKARNGFIDEKLLMPEEKTGLELLSDVQDSLTVCLQLSKDDFDNITEAKNITTFGIKSSDPSNPYDKNNRHKFANLSYLYAVSRLMKKLKLNANDFNILVKLTGIDIQNSPKDTLLFIKKVSESKGNPLKPADIQFMLMHKIENLPDVSDRELKNDKIKKLLEKLQKDYQDKFTLNKSPYDDSLSSDEQKEVLENALSKLKGIAEEDVKTVVKFVNKEWTSQNDAKIFISNKFSAVLTGPQITAIDNAVDDLAATPDTSAGYENKRKALIKAFLDSLAHYQFTLEKIDALEQTITATFKSELELVKIVLAYARLKQPGTGTDLIRGLLLSDTLIDTDITHATPVLPSIDDSAFDKQYKSLRLLHKLLPLIASFRLEIAETEWFFKNNHDLAWFEWDAIPYESGQLPVDYKNYASFAEMLSMAKQLTPVPNPADAENPVTFLKVAEMLLTESADRTTEFMESFKEQLSLLIGYPKEDVVAVDEYLFNAGFNPDNYRDAENWKSLMTCLERLRKIGSTVTQVKGFIKPVLSGDETNQLRMALKARYDEDTWLSTLKEIMDTIRPQKRNALVAYLLAVNPEMKDENDLYDYFLADVEMEACMPSSRIVQAHGSIQLFVQRCLMGLEPKAAADTDNDNGWNQWKWMKNYRVWEANRKVFLYPENWIEAELRDDKSFLFTELENELLQNELTDFTAEGALIRYLEKLDNIAFLEVMATWYQSDIRTMHVFARTKGGDPGIYYYRKFEKEIYWTPWEKVDLDIAGDHLLAFVRNNRLCLAWPVFSEEPNPDMKSKLPDQSDTGPQPIDKPERKLKIQLAVSELANNKWQPKKISKDAITTPSYYTTYEIPRENLKLFYSEFAQQVLIFNTVEREQMVGAFDITGCKGYPELSASKGFVLDFLPKFRDTRLINQRYKEMNYDETDDLSVLNVHSVLANKQFDEILHQTPGTFRITYPHQFTMIDAAVLLYERLMANAHGSYTAGTTGMMVRSLRIALGTLLPYFMEDSNHAYVIIPGFYGKEVSTVKRTCSDALQLVEDITAFIKAVAKYNSTQPQDPAKLNELINDYNAIMAEFKVYRGLKYGEQFKNMYHPLICPLRTILYKNGIPELMKRETQLQQNMNFDFKGYYLPNVDIVPKSYAIEMNGVKTLSYPVEDIDFTIDGSYSCYNWELFFHVPFLIATRLTKNQRFEEALTWFHYMFNPTGALTGTIPQKYWVTKPFYLTHDEDYENQLINNLLYKVADPTTPEIADLEKAIGEWRDKPFKPHVVARFRPVAYQKALLMKYIDNLTEWGDYLFRQDTMESITQATQMYIIADKLLGPKPRIIPPAIKAPYETYNQIKGKLDAFGNALIELENLLPDLSALPEGGAELPPAPVTLSMLYFCIPQNDKMLEYWDLIADRLFKIRNCQNIDGVERSLALFAPPIDPGMLVRAAAAGLDVSSILAGINAPVPYYRFNVLSQKATELAQEVRGLGSSLLQALEKKDAEGMSLLRSELEIKVLNAVKDIKLLQIEEAKEQIEVLNRTKAVTEERNKYYSSIQKISSNEQLNLNKLSESNDWQVAANFTYTLGSALALIPDFALGVSGFGGSPHGAAKFGGSLLAHSTDAIGKGLSIFSSIASYEANRASILGGYDRRFDDWKLQERLAKKELDQIDKQIAAAEIRKEIAETELKNHELQIENAQKTDEFMRSKFTNEELYQWMTGQISSVYFKAYQLAHDFAKKAERCYRFELGNDDSFIQYGYWDSLKKGLQSADNLIHDIKRMETTYMDKNKREYELTKHVSLAMLDPLALAVFKSTGVCDFEIPEAVFDMDYAGHYFRRIKSVSISLPCIAGPYTSVSAKLSLVSSKYRKNTAVPTEYKEDLGNDERFVYNVGAIQSIAVSNAQNDSGIFELNFRDERYLPFEGAGAISSWRLELPKEIRQFDYNTISDVILHIKYTAREGGSTLRGLAETTLKERLAEVKQQLSQKGLHAAINMRTDCPNEWYLFRKNGSIDLDIDKSRLPYMAQTIDLAIENVIFVAKINGKQNSISLKVDNNLDDNINGVDVNLSRIKDEWDLFMGDTKSKNISITLNKPFRLSVSESDLNNIEELVMIVKYSF